MVRLESIICILNFFSILLANEATPRITISSGDIQGGIGQTQNNRPYYYFTGVPYAKPPLGWYRFEPAVPPKSWNDTYDATRTTPVCVQYKDRDLTEIIGDEDCLYLNVYTPQLPDEDKALLPVMFYIGGEHFEHNDASKEKLGPELLLDKDVVLVTINYRLGALGFFVTEDHTIKYNIGLRDQVQALKWVRKNIAQFGGNPYKVTVFGHSAGGASAHYLMLSPLSKDLISGVIAQSGTALNLWAYSPIQAVGIRSRTVAGLSGCPTRDTNAAMIKCLKTVNVKEIINATSVLRRDSSMLLFKPVLEKFIEKSFLPEDPIDIIKEESAADVPIITGITAENGAYEAEVLLNTPNTLEKINEKFEEIASWLLYYGMTAIVKNRIPFGKRIREFYFKDYSINEATKKELTNMYTDAWFLEGLKMSTDLHVKFSKKPTYNYLFGYRGSESHLNELTSKKNGACHKDELLYLFTNTADFPDYKQTETDKKVSDLLITLWTNFATYGNPTPPEDTSVPFVWEPVVSEKENYLYIKKNGEAKIQQKIFPERSDFWMSLMVDSRRERIRDEL